MFSPFFSDFQEIFCHLIGFSVTTWKLWKPNQFTGKSDLDKIFLNIFNGTWSFDEIYDTSFPLRISSVHVNKSQIRSFLTKEAVARRCSVKMLLVEISQNSQENTCATVSFLIKLQAPAPLLKKDSGTGVFLWVLRNF